MANKYNNKVTEVDGKRFASKKEANYYQELCLRLKAKDIDCFILQPRYLLQDGFVKNGQRYRPIYYVADFKIIHNDLSVEVVDCKGKKTQVYGIKKKLFEKLYPDLTITEI